MTPWSRAGSGAVDALAGAGCGQAGRLSGRPLGAVLIREDTEATVGSGRASGTWPHSFPGAGGDSRRAWAA